MKWLLPLLLLLPFDCLGQSSGEVPELLDLKSNQGAIATNSTQAARNESRLLMLEGLMPQAAQPCLLILRIRLFSL
jgi:hypothetical protein